MKITFLFYGLSILFELMKSELLTVEEKNAQLNLMKVILEKNKNDPLLLSKQISNAEDRETYILYLCSMLFFFRFYFSESKKKNNISFDFNVQWPYLACLKIFFTLKISKK